LLAGDIDARGDVFGGRIDVHVSDLLSLTGALHTDARATQPPPESVGGTITLSACTIDASSTSAVISSTGQGAPDNSSNVLAASHAITIGGSVLAGADGADQLHHNVMKTLPGAVVTIRPSSTVVPQADVVSDLSLPCCFACATTTTSTTTLQVSTSTTT